MERPARQRLKLFAKVMKLKLSGRVTRFGVPLGLHGEQFLPEVGCIDRPQQAVILRRTLREISDNNLRKLSRIGATAGGLGTEGSEPIGFVQSKGPACCTKHARELQEVVDTECSSRMVKLTSDVHSSRTPTGKQKVYFADVDSES